METTLNLSETLVRAAQERAAARGQSFAKFVEEALTAEVGRPAESPAIVEKAEEENSEPPVYSEKALKNLEGWRKILGTLSPEAMAEARKLSKYFQSAEHRKIDPEDWK